MKKDADYFADEPPGHRAELVFVAKRLKDAIRVEEVFTNAGVNFGVEPDEYQGGIIFKTARVGAFFYVRQEAREQAVAVLLENGYVPVEPNGETGAER
ncbi:MAG TPA: hypothetical protein VEF06_16125 [Bryobacteraceae bacterium]|nr:hypothetical protein [Bryobacteraceae bacterium]